MNRPRLKLAILSAVGMSIATPALAEWAVFDGTMIGKAVAQLQELKTQTAEQLEQLGQLKQSVSFLNDITTFANQTSSTLGQVASFSLPIGNLSTLAAQTKSDLQCLIPDGGGWGIKITDLNLGSVCDTSSVYQSALFTSAKGLLGHTSAEQNSQRLLVQTHRTALLGDTATRSLAKADIQINQADTANKAADDLQTNLGAAQTVQDRLQVIAQIDIALLRGQAQQTQLLAQLLKLQGALAAAGLPADQVDAPTSSGSGQ